MEALNLKSTPKSSQEDDDADSLADMFANLGIVKSCDICQIKWETIILIFSPFFYAFFRLDESNTASGTNKCHDCNKILSLQNQKMRAQTGSLPPTSAKIRKILELLEEISHRDDKEKTIIFSQFTTMLDLLEPFLTNAGFRHVRCRIFLNLNSPNLLCCRRWVDESEATWNFLTTD